MARCSEFPHVFGEFFSCYDLVKNFFFLNNYGIVEFPKSACFSVVRH